MPSVSHIIRLRQRRREQGNSSPASRVSRIGLALSLLLSCMVALIAIGLTQVYADLTQDLPSPETLPALLEPPNGQLLRPTRLYDRTGEHVIQTLQNPAIGERQYLPIDESQNEHLSTSLIDATIAAADPKFWYHSGFLLEDLRLTLLSGQSRRKTLAQRLVSDLLLWSEQPGLRRTLREHLLAAQVTARYGREKVMEWYLNSANYGRLNLGAQSAAFAYFGKSAKELTLAQEAILAAVAEAPSLNPHDSPQAAEERSLDVLQSMHEQGLITAERYSQATQEEITFQPAEDPPVDPAPALTNLVLEQLAEKFDRERVLRGGLRIVTSLDYDLQLQTNCAAANQIAQLKDPQVQEMPASDGTACQAARLLPTIPKSGQDKRGEVSANVVVIDPKSGHVLAMVGDTKPGFDPAHLPGQPPGSLLTPFIYLTAFSRGLSPSSLLWDIPASTPEIAGEVSNPDGRFHGPVRLRVALANDYLVPASQVLTQMGAESVWRTAHQLGLNTLEIPTGEEANRLHIEGGEVTLLDITRAFGVLANQGLLIGESSRANSTNGASSLQPVTVLQVTDEQELVWLDCKEPQVQCDLQTRPVTSAQLAYLMTHILSDETIRWPSLGHPNPLEIGRPAAAKIGQTLNEGDVWTVGFTPSLVVGTWLGSDLQDIGTPLPTSGAAGLWHAIMQYATRNTPLEDWEPPPGITTLSVCDPSGLLPTKECPVVVSEVFQAGNEPTHADNLFQSLQINRESGNLATIFTPPELIEERGYMIVPPEAEEWARQAGLKTIRVSYDNIEAPEPPKEDAQITSPEMFLSVSGRVPILGSAGGPGFSFYRLLAIGYKLGKMKKFLFLTDSWRCGTAVVLAVSMSCSFWWREKINK